MEYLGIKYRLTELKDKTKLCEGCELMTVCEVQSYEFQETVKKAKDSCLKKANTYKIYTKV